MAAGRNFAAFLLLCLAGGLLAAPAAAQQLLYQVLRDGDDIGEHSVTFNRQGEALTVDVKMVLAVKVAFITVFRFEHERQESWDGGRLVSLEGKTNDDGDDYLVSIDSAEVGYRWTVNGTGQDLSEPLMPVSLWNKAVIGPSRLVSAVGDKLYQVSSALVGKESLETGRGPVEAEHYRISGDLQRDLWYDAQGQLLRVVFESRGSEIEYRLK